jgi:hypothetical protein
LCLTVPLITIILCAVVRPIWTNIKHRVEHLIWATKTILFIVPEHLGLQAWVLHDSQQLHRRKMRTS